MASTTDRGYLYLYLQERGEQVKGPMLKSEVPMPVSTRALHRGRACHHHHHTVAPR